MALAVCASAGSFLALEALLPASVPKLAAVYGAAAINLFYWWAAPGPEWIAWPLRAAVLALTVVWLRRTFAKERVFLERQGLPTPPRAARLGRGARAALHAAGRGGGHVRGGRAAGRSPGPARRCSSWRRRADQTIEAGCRMGVCGADPVCVLTGMENLSPVGGDEQATLERLGLDPAHNRMACCARVQGPVTVSMTPRRDSNVVVSIDFPFDPAVEAGRGDRQRHRGRHGRRPRPPPPSGLRDRRRRRRAASALQPHGHLAADLRALGDGRPAPAAGRLVRRQPHHLLAQHARAGDRPRRRRGACSAPASGSRSTG